MTALEVLYPPQQDADDALVTLWLDTHRQHPETRRSYDATLRQFRSWVQKPLARVELQDLQRWAEQLYREGRAASTVRLRFRHLRVFYLFARELGPRRGGLAEVPLFGGVDLKPATETVGCRLVPDVEAVLAQLEGRERLVVELLFYGGFRRAELAGLCWRDILLVGRKGKALVRQTKNGKPRYVTIPTRLWARVYELQGKPDESVTGLSKQGIYRLVKRAAKAAGFPAVSPHWFRHSCATEARQAGASWDQVAAHLGHSNSEITQKIYGHLTHDTTAADILEGQDDES